jgi:hypothetical protein
MPRYLIEWRFPEGFDSFFLKRPTDLIIATNNETGVTWLHSYITDDSRRVYCVYEAPSPEALHKASRRTGWPVHRINRITILQPHPYPIQKAGPGEGH